jgi:hypothetical protein
VTVAFAVLSHAGHLTITLVPDPDTCPDASTLRELVEDELRVPTGTDGSPRENARSAPASSSCSSCTA